MAGTVLGGKKAAATNLANDPEFYRKIGSVGGKKGTTCGIISVMNKLKNIPINEEYRVSDAGVVFGKSGKPMKPQFDQKGYLRVQIKTPHKDNGVTTLKVHRVVAESFIPNPNNLPQVDHIDGDRSNNTVKNLEWVTNEENQRRAVKRGAYDGRKPHNLISVGGQILTAIENGYVATDLFDLNGLQRKTFWKYVNAGDIVATPITDLILGRKKKYYYYDGVRGKWRVERSDYAEGRQFDTEQEAKEYSEKNVGGGFYANRELAKEAGAKGGRNSKRGPWTPEEKARRLEAKNNG